MKHFGNYLVDEDALIIERTYTANPSLTMEQRDFFAWRNTWLFGDTTLIGTHVENRGGLKTTTEYYCDNKQCRLIPSL